MENKTLDTALTVLSLVIGVVGLIMGIMIMGGNESIIGSAITLSMVIMGVAAAIAILFGLVHFITHIKSNLPMLIGVVVFVILVIVCYNMASSEIMPSYSEDITASSSKMSGAGLMVMYVLVIIATAAALVGEVTRIFK